MVEYPVDLERHRKWFYQSLSEKDRRRYAAIEAEKLGYGGVEGKVIALPEDTAVMFSCRKGQQAYESEALQHGLFT